MMSPTSKCELVAALRPRYTLGNRSAKQRVLDELVAATGYHRKYAIQLLNPPAPRRSPKRRTSRSKYDGRVRAALEQIWRAANCICELLHLQQALSPGPADLCRDPGAPR